MNLLIELILRKINFASSTQEDIDTMEILKDSRILFLDESNKIILSLWLNYPKCLWTICRPNYNSFISTFCYNSILGKTNKIIEDNQVNLIYIDNNFKNNRIDL